MVKMFSQWDFNKIRFQCYVKWAVLQQLLLLHTVTLYRLLVKAQDNLYLNLSKNLNYFQLFLVLTIFPANIIGDFLWFNTCSAMDEPHCSRFIFRFQLKVLGQNLHHSCHQIYLISCRSFEIRSLDYSSASKNEPHSELHIYIWIYIQNIFLNLDLINSRKGKKHNSGISPSNNRKFRNSAQDRIIQIWKVRKWSIQMFENKKPVRAFLGNHDFKGCFLEHNFEDGKLFS